MMALVGELSQILQWPSNLWTSSAKDPNFKWKNPSQIWKTYILYTLKFRGILHNTFDTKKKSDPEKFPGRFVSSPPLHHDPIAVKPPTLGRGSGRKRRRISTQRLRWEGIDGSMLFVWLVDLYWFMLGGQKKVAIKSHHPSFQWKVNVKIDTNSQKSWL